MKRRFAAALLAILAIALVPAALAAARPAPGTPDPFFGVVLQNDQLSDVDVSRMSNGGVGTVRVMVPWHRAEKTEGTYNWGFLDQRFRSIEAAGALPLPMIYGSPTWIGEIRDAPLADDGQREAWQRFLTDLVGRYGPDGDLESSGDGFAGIDRWQIWNEPNLSGFWRPAAPNAADYVELLNLSEAAIHAVDPAARIIAAGLAPGRRSISPPDFVTQMYGRYAQLGTDPAFDEVSVHPYAATVAESVGRVKEFHAAVQAAGGGLAMPILVGELGWGSAKPRDYLGGTEKTQARHLVRAYDAFGKLRRPLNLSSVLWFSWQDSPPGSAGCSFCTYTGLTTYDGRAKESWKAFRRLRK